MSFGLMRHLNLVVCESPEEAVEKGFKYSDETHTLVNVENVVIVRNGMQSGAASVDFVMEDKDGNKYVFMVTGNLLKSIPC
jgi:hypothetical protein